MTVWYYLLCVQINSCQSRDRYQPDMAASNSPILSKYHALERLGSGAYGNPPQSYWGNVAFPIFGTGVLGLAYRAADVTEVSESSTQYAVKLERASKKRQPPPSDHEANVLQILSDANVSPRISRVIDYGYDKPSHSKALVLDLLGADLHFMCKNYGGRFNIKTTLLQATQLVRVPGLCSVSL